MRPKLSDIQRVCEKGVDLHAPVAVDLVLEIYALREIAALYRRLAAQSCPHADVARADDVATSAPVECARLFAVDLRAGLYDEPVEVSDFFRPRSWL